MPCFKPELISETVLQRLLKQNVVVNFRLTDPNSQDCYIFSRGKICDYFLIILQVSKIQDATEALWWTPHIFGWGTGIVHWYRLRWHCRENQRDFSPWFLWQGRVEVDIGREHMVFEGGPFMYFGLQALTGRSWRLHLSFWSKNKKQIKIIYVVFVYEAKFILSMYREFWVKWKQNNPSTIWELTKLENDYFPFPFVPNVDRKYQT